MQLPGLLRKYGNELEADFQEYYRLDLNDLYLGRISPAKVFRLAYMLPAQSRFIRSAIGPSAEWTTSEHMLAAVVDSLSAANWQRGGGKGSKPKPLPRPGEKRQETRYGKTDRSPQEVITYFNRVNAGEFEG